MKKNNLRRWIGRGAVLIILGLAPQGVVAQIDDPAYSIVDGISFADPAVNCDEAVDSELCEMVQAAQAYSQRDGVAFSDCSVVCDELYECDACLMYRQAHPCPIESDNPSIALID